LKVGELFCFGINKVSIEIFCPNEVSPKANAKFPSTFISNYNPIEKLIVTPDNIDEFLKE
jgi:hypothetical protein